MGEQYDITIIGGGIHGAYLAEAGAAAGYRCLLLERSRPAAGTSSRSSKLIHGGLRYLESGQLGLVRECLHERRLLLRRAPELVQLRPFLIPIYPQTRRRPWQIRAGLSLYALLGGLRPETWFRCLPPAEQRHLGELRQQDLQAVFRYYDGQTDDAALTRAVLGSAAELGAAVRHPAEFLGAQRQHNGWRLGYRGASGAASAYSRCLVNAAGPWVNPVLRRIEPHPPTLPVELVQGTHVLLNAPAAEAMYYVEAEDGRAVFVMPWKGQTLVGTTETPYAGAPDAVEPLDQEVEYLLRTYRHYFARRPVVVEDAFAGLRVLPAGGGSAFARSRDVQLHADRNRQPTLVSIYGGKLTAARLTAQRVLDLLRPSLPRRTALCAAPWERPLNPEPEAAG